MLAEFYAQIESEHQSGIENGDLATMKDPLQCGEYAADIHDYLKDVEKLHIATPGYLREQTDITEKMRAILLDWLVEVHLKFKLMPETLYLTVNLIDRYLERKQVQRQKL